MKLINCFSILLKVDGVSLCGLRRCSGSHNLIQSLLSMPREVKTNQELKQIRLKIKEKGAKYPPGIVSLQVLGSGAYGAPKSLYVFTDQSRYLFNVGEGSQRLAHEHKMKLSKLEHIFITRPIWENIGGLPGVALTIQDVGVPEITLHGPDGTNDIFPATRRFVVLKDLSVKMATCNRSTVFEDNVMSVNYVPIVAAFEKESKTSDASTGLHSCALEEADDVDYYGHERRISGQPPRQALVDHVPAEPVKERIPSVAMCYICKLKPKPGALILEACVERGVPPGPLLGRLKNGEDIVLPNGTEVKSCDVTSAEDPGPVFIVVDCPSLAYLDVLVNEPLFAPHQADASVEDLKAYAVVHFTPTDIVDHPKYRDWIARFPQETTHLVINASNTCSGSVAVHRIQHKLHMVHPEIFPLLKDNQPQNSEFSHNLGSLVKEGTLASIQLRPRKGLDLSQTLFINPQDYINEEFNNVEFKQELEKYKRQTSEISIGNEEYPKIVFLGTGSCIPNKTRNTSGILVHLSKQESAILDCGEATFNQILRLYGYEGSKRVLSTLKMVYVSHLHADHHIGLVGLLKGRRKLLGPDAKRVILMAPKQIMFWLNFYHARFEDILEEFWLQPNSEMKAGNSRVETSEIRKVLSDLGCSDVGTVHVKHCPNAFGIALTHQTGWKVTYSGDTMPCQDLVALGMNSDILIHEATMEDELEDEARLKYHSTTSQAIAVGRAMNAKFILLTHFSQRYAKIPRLNENLTDNLGIAFDNMEVSMGQLPLLSRMYPVLKLMFADHYEEMEAKAMRRNLRMEKKRAASQSPQRGTKIQANLNQQ